MKPSSKSEAISLRDCKKLKTLRCNWGQLFPFADDDVVYDDESLETGFHKEDEELPSDKVDVGATLPESLEALHIIGPFPDDTGEDAVDIFTNRDGALPNLKILYIHGAGRATDEGYQLTDQGPQELDFAVSDTGFQPLNRLLEGHGYA